MTPTARPQLTIRPIRGPYAPFMPLLLIGDESEPMIERYIGRATLYAGFVGTEVVAVCATTDEGPVTIEVKNLAVAPDWRRRGIGRRMLAYAESRNPGKTIVLGTGETPSTLRFYRSCGYTFTHRIPGFFVLNYSRPIVEEGVRLSDMLYFSKQSPG